MNRTELIHILSALEACEAELEQLVASNDWYVTSVTDQVTSAKEIVLGELNENPVA